MATINGTFFNDTLNGTAEADVINGAGGNDTISGNGGDDTITGGMGTDRFKFAAGDGKDTIKDLTAGETVEIRGYSSAQSIT